MGGDRVMMIKDGMRMNEGYGADGANDVVGTKHGDALALEQAPWERSSRTADCRPMRRLRTLLP